LVFVSANDIVLDLTAKNLITLGGALLCKHAYCGDSSKGFAVAAGSHISVFSLY